MLVSELSEDFVRDRFEGFEEVEQTGGEILFRKRGLLGDIGDLVGSTLGPHSRATID